MAPWAASARERRRTCEDCRDLHQTQSVLVAGWGVGRALRGREPPSFEPMQEDLRICFETPEDGKESRVDRAPGTAPIAAHNNIVRRTIASLGNRVKTLLQRNSGLFARRVGSNVRLG